MIGKQQLHRILMVTNVMGCLCLMMMMPTDRHSWAQEFDVAASSAIPETLVHIDAGLFDHPGMSFAIIVDKSHQLVNLYRHDGYWRLVTRWPCSTGKLAGPKTLEGDRRTPEGIYFATRDVGPRYLTETYGARALPLDYPNWLDRRLSRSGSAIWLHGTNKPLQARDSNGCIVLENDAIQRLAPYIRLNRTPVIIVDRLRLWAIKDARQIAEAILSAAGQWHEALIHGSYKDLQQWYDPGAAPSMQWWRAWCRMRRTDALEFRYGSIMGQRAIYRYGDYYVLLFDHVLKTASHSQWVGRRKLFLSSDGDNVRIFGDTYQAVPRSEHDPLLHAWRLLRAMEQKDNQVAANEKEKRTGYILE